jgi:hypothetical protein
MFEKATRGLQAVEVSDFDDVGCTCVVTYHIWYGEFVRSGKDLADKNAD